MTKLSREMQWEAVRLSKTGLSLREIARLIEVSKSSVGNVLVRQATRKPPPKEWNPSPARLSMAEREEIRAGLERGDSFTAIAREIGRTVSTVSREVTGKSGREHYRATTAHHSAGHRARRPKPQKLVSGPLLDKVTEWLEEWWSPEEISPSLAFGVPTRSDDEGESRDDLSVALRPGTRRTSTRAVALSSDRPGRTSTTGSSGTEGTYSWHGHDL